MVLTSFKHNSGFFLEIEEVKERRVQPSRIHGRLLPLSSRKSSVLSSVGDLEDGYWVLHQNAVYFMRKKYI